MGEIKAAQEKGMMKKTRAEAKAEKVEELLRFIESLPTASIEDLGFFSLLHTPHPSWGDVGTTTISMPPIEGGLKYRYV